MVYRPQLKAPARPEHIVAQKVDDRHPVIQHAPVVPPKTERPLVAENRGNVTRGPAPSSGGNWQQSGTGKYPAGNTQPQPAAKSYRSTPTAASASPAMPAPRNNEQPRSAPLTPPNRYPQERVQPSATPAPRTQSSASSEPAVQTPANRQYPLRSGTPTYSQPPRPNAPVQNSGTYYPKGYYQSSEARSAPAMAPRTPEPRTYEPRALEQRTPEPRPQPSVNARPQTPPDNGPRSQAGPGRGRNDQ